MSVDELCMEELWESVRDEPESMLLAFQSFAGCKGVMKKTKVRKKSLFERKKINGFGDIWSWKYKTRIHKEVRTRYELFMGDRERRNVCL